MRQYPAKTLALAVCGCTALWSVQAAAQQGGNSQATLEQMQQQIQQLQQQIQQMKAQRQQQQAQATQQPPKKKVAKTQAGPKKKLNIGGSSVVQYQLNNHDAAPHQHDGGDFNFDYFAINAQGQYGNLTFAAEERFSPNNFGGADEFLHKGWAAYDFMDHHQVNGGFMQVPFGNYPTGYQNFWGNLAYFAGFTDNQAAGVGYKYENGPWRVDVAGYKNDDLGQSSLYGSNPFQGYEQVNGGAGRLAYTFNQGGDNTVNVSLSARGGELDVGDKNRGQGFKNGSYGNHWAVSAAADASLGLWTVQGQFVDYRYNIPSGRGYDGNKLSTHSITFENYGSESARLPSRGQVYTLNIARDFPVDNLGPIEKFTIYNNYGYIHSGRGNCDSSVDWSGRGLGSNLTCAGGNGYRIGDIQENVTGATMLAGPVQIWADVILGKNDALAFNGPNDGDWHPRFNLAFGIYFDGDVIE